MKLLIITQKIDKNDPVLGFFHNWVLKLSEKFEKINVICLGKGEYDLPDNVSVHSLGKQNIVTRNSYIVTRLKYIWKFYKYIWHLRGEYDAVFVHMNQEYVVLGWKFWKLLGKKIFLWRNHPKGNFFTDIAALVSEKVFYTSPKSYTAKFKNSVLMPVGIDTDLFTLESRIQNLESRKAKILSLGRISPIKNIDKIVDAAILLDSRNVDFVLDIVGDPINPEDVEYLESLKKKAENLITKNKVNFLRAVSQEKVVELYQTHEIFVNLTPSGSMDKTILEAMSCGSLPVVSNEYYKDMKPVIFTGISSQDVAQNLDVILTKEPNTETASLRQYVVENHGLNALIGKLVKEIKNV
jgi:glycosyltransferase involved in cell wall biosynthesis